MSDRFVPSKQKEFQLNQGAGQVPELLGHPPAWSLRWGISAIFLGIILFLILGWLIKYPDVIEAKAVILTENPAKWPHVDSLERVLKDLEQKMNVDDFLQTAMPSKLQLGSLQRTYAALQQASQDFHFFIEQQAVEAQLHAFHKQRKVLEQLNRSLETQMKTIAQEVEIARRDWERNQELLREDIISERDLDQVERNYLQSRQQLESFQTQILSNQLQMEQIGSDILNVNQTHAQSKMKKWLAIQELIQGLGSEIKLWKQRNLVIAPIEGRLSLSKIWSPQQYVQMNEEIGTIVPEKLESKIVGRAMLPMRNSGKVQPNMRINIRLDSYPYQEFGVIHASVASLSLVPQDGMYLLDMMMPDSLLTSYGHSIPFAQELTGTARIITKDRRILARIFDQFLNLFKNN